jgi:hypothetical protein
MALVSQPYNGIGTTLGYRVGSSGSFTLLGLLADDMDFGPITNGVAEVKLLNSAYLQKVAGRQDPGDINGTIYFVDGDAGVSEMWALSQSRATYEFQIQVPDGTPPVGSAPPTGTTYVASGFVSNYAPTGFIGDDVVTAGFTIAVSGQWTRTLGS